MFSEKTLALCKRIKDEKLEKIGERTIYVLFDFGCYVYVGVTIYKGLTIDECLYLRSEDIERYYDEESKEWKKLNV